MEDLKGRACISGWRPHQKATWVLRSEAGEQTSIEVRTRHEFTDGEAMLAAVVSGCGIMQIPTWLAAGEIKKGTLMPLLPEFAGGEMPIHAIWSATRYMKPKTRAIIDCLKSISADPESGFNL